MIGAIARLPGVPSRNRRFADNVVAGSDEVREAVNIGPGTAAETFTFAGNFWYCLDRPEESRAIARRLPAPETGGVHGRDPGFRDAERGDVRA
jgi:hypothetical protein